MQSLMPDGLQWSLVLPLRRLTGPVCHIAHRWAPAGRRLIHGGRERGRGAAFAKCGEAVSSDSLHKFLGQLLCLLGFHDYHVISGTFGFGGAGNVEKIECRRCGDVTTRQA